MYCIPKRGLATFRDVVYLIVMNISAQMPLFDGCNWIVEVAQKHNRTNCLQSLNFYDVLLNNFLC